MIMQAHANIKRPLPIGMQPDTQALDRRAQQPTSIDAANAISLPDQREHLYHHHEHLRVKTQTVRPANLLDSKTYSVIDIEAQSVPITPVSTPPTDLMAEKGRAPSDSTTVTFEGPEDPLNPKNWPAKQKWAATACIAAFTFISPLASTMVAPALDRIRDDLDITNAVEQQMVLSIFVLAFAIGPMLLGPLSELYGRVVVTQASSVCFLVFNTICGFASTKEQLLVFRFFAGFGGSAPLAIGGGVIGDLFKPEERGKAMGLYAMGPLLGPALGPIIGAWVTERSTWKWMFWAVSIANGVILVAGFLAFKETYAPYILHRKARALRKSTGNAALKAEGESDVEQPVWQKVVDATKRSFRMLLTQPIVQVMSLYMGFSFGILYLMLSTYSDLFLTRYHESIGISGLNYISLGLGLFIGAPICGKSNDVVYMRLKAKDPQNRGRPEFRMPLIVPFSLLVPSGLLIYGWTAQAGVHWIVPNIGVFIFGMGTIAAFQCVTTYLVDAYTRYAASAIAAVTILRSLMGFAFPLFAPAMYRVLDYGWGNSLLAFLALAIGVPTPIFLWFWGERLRKRSSMAVGARPSGAPPANASMLIPAQRTTEPAVPETVASATRTAALTNSHVIDADITPVPADSQMVAPTKD